MKVSNTVLLTVQALVTTWDNSGHPGRTQSMRLLRQPHDESMLHVFIAGETMSFQAGNRGTSLGNKSRFFGDSTNRNFQPSSASHVACAVVGHCHREEPHHPWKDRKVFSLWPTISVAKKKNRINPPTSKRVTTAKSRRCAPPAHISRITRPWKLGPSVVQINKTLNFSDFDFPNINP